MAASVTPYIKLSAILAKRLLTAITINDGGAGFADTACYRTFYNYHSSYPPAFHY